MDGEIQRRSDAALPYCNRDPFHSVTYKQGKCQEEEVALFLFAIKNCDEISKTVVSLRLQNCNPVQGIESKTLP